MQPFINSKFTVSRVIILNFPDQLIFSFSFQLTEQSHGQKSFRDGQGSLHLVMAYTRSLILPASRVAIAWSTLLATTSHLHFYPTTMIYLTRR